MKRSLAALVIALFTGGVGYFEISEPGAGLRGGFDAWLGANALPAKIESISAIELPADEPEIHALDAALVLRAVLRFQPRAIGYLVPVEPGDDASLLLSKLADAKGLPIVFTSNANLEPWPEVGLSGALPQFPKLTALAPSGQPVGGMAATTAGEALIAARQASRAVPSVLSQVSLAVDVIPAAGVTGGIPGSVRAGSIQTPVDADGRAAINPLAARFVKGIAFDQLMLKIERSEQGDVSVDLDALFRGRIVVVEIAGGHEAEALAALRNGLTESPAPLAVSVAVGLLAVTLPWWPGGRRNRALLALGVTSAWALGALATYQEFRISVPMSLAMLLPLLALIPPGALRRGSDKVEDRKLAA